MIHSNTQRDPPKYKNINCSQATYEDLKCKYQIYQDLKCAHPAHQQPIQIVILDPNLKENERLLCKTCIKEFESNYKTIGLEKAFALTYENYQKKRELREMVFNENIKQLEQLNKNFISLKNFINQKIDKMIQTNQNWMKDVNQVKSQQYQFLFYYEIDYLIKQKQKIGIDQIVEDIKIMNNKWISNLSKKLEWFSKFKEYSDCVNILKNLSRDQGQKQYQKKEYKEYNKVDYYQPPNQKPCFRRTYRPEIPYQPQIYLPSLQAQQQHCVIAEQARTKFRYQQVQFERIDQFQYPFYIDSDD